MLPVAYKIVQLEHLGVFPSHFDFLLLHAIQAVLTHRRLLAAESLLLRLRVFSVFCLGTPPPSSPVLVNSISLTPPLGTSN